MRWTTRILLFSSVLWGMPGDAVAKTHEEVGAQLNRRTKIPTANSGSAAVLKGRVLVVHIFVSTPGAPWTEGAKKSALSRAEAGTHWLTEQARAQGVDLEWVKETRQVVALRSTTSSDPLTVEWSDAVIASAMGKNSVSALEERTKRRGAAHGLYLLHLNVQDRSFALPSPIVWAERAVLFRSNKLSAVQIQLGSLGSAGALPEELAHEVLHLFGAPDLYEPAAVQKIATEYFPDDIMLSASSGAELGWFTAMRVGWQVDMPLDPYADEGLASTQGDAWSYDTEHLHLGDTTLHLRLPSR